LEYGKRKKKRRSRRSGKNGAKDAQKKKTTGEGHKKRSNNTHRPEISG